MTPDPPAGLSGGILHGAGFADMQHTRSRSTGPWVIVPCSWHEAGRYGLP